MKNIEAEVRSFISKEQYDNLLEFFNRKAKLAADDYQETYYFYSEEDLRIQKNNFFSKIWMKKGKLHDDCREEMEIKFDRDDFEKLESLFLLLGFKIRIKWFRKRLKYDWDGIKACVDHTKGYGYIIELERLCRDSEKEETLNLLKQKLAELDIQLTPKEEFEKRFKHYEENWEELVKE